MYYHDTIIYVHLFSVHVIIGINRNGLLETWSYYSLVSIGFNTNTCISEHSIVCTIAYILCNFTHIKTIYLSSVSSLELDKHFIQSLHCRSHMFKELNGLILCLVLHSLFNWRPTRYHFTINHHNGPWSGALFR